MRSLFCYALCLWLCTTSVHCRETKNTDIENNWAVIVSTSRYWFNYRHASNALTVYWTLRNLGMPDDRIILMNAQSDASADLRNAIPGTILSSSDDVDVHVDLMLDAQFDYLGEAVNPKTLMQVLAGRHDSDTLSSLRMNSNQDSNILIFMTGHGGDEFLKFHDNEEISAFDFQLVFMEMHLKMRYKSILFIVETCQAATISKYITAPNVYTLSSSLASENSYSYYSNSAVGVSVIDRFTFSLGQFFDTYVGQHLAKLRASIGIDVGFPLDNNGAMASSSSSSRSSNSKTMNHKQGKKSLKQLLDHFVPSFLHSTASFQGSDYPGMMVDNRHRNNALEAALSKIPVMRYFHGARAVQFHQKEFVNVAVIENNSIQNLDKNIAHPSSNESTAAMNNSEHFLA